MPHPSSSPALLHYFTHHKVAGNLLMLIMILAGGWALLKINVQFFPTMHFNFVSIQIAWPGASAEDVERALLNPIERNLRHLDDLKSIDSTATPGKAKITLEFYQHADMNNAAEKVRQEVDQLRQLPPDAEKPIISKYETYEPIAKVLVQSSHPESLRPLVRNMENQLLQRGIAKITVTGLPHEEIAIEVPSNKLAELNTSLNQLGTRINELSQDVPAGVVGRGQFTQRVRSLAQRRSAEEFTQLPIVANDQGQLIKLGDIAHITRRPRENSVTIQHLKQPAVELSLFRTTYMNSLSSARILKQWVKDITPQLPPGVSLTLYDQAWQHLAERIALLLKNALGGLILILIVLYLLLHRIVATWVAIGIPVSFLGALMAIYLLGGSINMISLFATIMGLGIIVDDTLVVGEEALSLYQSGQPAITAIENAARKMFPPVMASSLTTICAFIPIALVSGIMGKFIIAIPLVIISVIIASLIECFLILPNHLLHSFKRFKTQDYPIRKTIDTRFQQFRETVFKPLVTKAIQYRCITQSLAFATLIVVVGIIASGHLSFDFFPSPENRMIQVNFQMLAGTPTADRDAFLQQLIDSLQATDNELSAADESHIITFASYLNRSADPNSDRDEFINSEERGSILLELTSTDKRSVTNTQFINHWRSKLIIPPSLLNLSIMPRQVGIPGKSLNIQLIGNDQQQLKQASNALQAELRQFKGVSNIEDNLPYGQQQIIYQLSQQGLAMGLTTQNLGQQIRAALSGHLVQLFHLPNEELEVRIMLPKSERDQLASLQHLPIVTAQNNIVPLDSIATLRQQRGIDIINHSQAQPSVNISASIDPNVNNANAIIKTLSKDFFKRLHTDYGIRLAFKGKNEEQINTLKDLRYGSLLAIIMIYIILAWVFRSYSMPLLILCTIPFGFIGAIIGHIVMGLNLTVLSLFGLFGLSGIVINDSIILLNCYKQCRQKYPNKNEAIVAAATQRLRPVLLTSLTTIAGLAPLLFETSFQAQFLIPLVTTLCFGLFMSTFLILLVLPAMISTFENIRTWISTGWKA